MKLETSKLRIKKILQEWKFAVLIRHHQARIIRFLRVVRKQFIGTYLYHNAASAGSDRISFKLRSL